MNSTHIEKNIYSLKKQKGIFNETIRDKSRKSSIEN